MSSLSSNQLRWSLQCVALGRDRFKAGLLLWLSFESISKPSVLAGLEVGLHC